MSGLGKTTGMSWRTIMPKAKKPHPWKLQSFYYMKNVKKTNPKYLVDRMIPKSHKRTKKQA